MNFIITTFFVIFAHFKNTAFGEGDDNFFVVSTSKPPTEYQNLNERLSKVEFYLEIRSALNILNESITELQKTKREYVREVETVLDKKLKRYDVEIQNLKEQLITAKGEIRNHSEKLLVDIGPKMDDQLTKIKEELSKAKEEVISENDQNIRKRLEQIKIELTKTNEEQLEKLRKQLIQTPVNLTAEIKNYKKLPEDCRDIQKQGTLDSGIYSIRPLTATDSFLVWCDMTTKGGGWTYILNRFDGSQNFYLNWTDYKQGFGRISAEHWLGLQHLYELTSSKRNELLFELVDWDLKKVYAKYDHFVTGNEPEDYIIKSVGNYFGDVRNSFENHVNRKFSTADHNNVDNCAVFEKGAWWYYSCYTVHLTGPYLNRNVTDISDRAMHWRTDSYYWNPKEAKMMIRPYEG